MYKRLLQSLGAITPDLWQVQGLCWICHNNQSHTYSNQAILPSATPKAFIYETVRSTLFKPPKKTYWGTSYWKLNPQHQSERRIKLYLKRASIHQPPSLPTSRRWVTEPLFPISLHWPFVFLLFPGILSFPVWISEAFFPSPPFFFLLTIDFFSQTIDPD